MHRLQKIEAQCRKQTKNNNYEVKIGGEMSDQVFKHLRINVVNYILNEQEQIIHISDEAELYEGKQTRLHIRYPSSALNNQLPTDPLKTISKEEQHLLFKEVRKTQWKWFKTITFLEDKGWLGESIEKSNSIEFVNETTDSLSSNLWNDDSRQFYRAIIVLSHKEEQHYRRYIKLQDILTISASFMKGIASVCWLYVIWQGQKQLDRKLVEEIFSISNKQINAEIEEIKSNSMVSTMMVPEKKNDKIPGFF